MTIDDSFKALVGELVELQPPRLERVAIEILAHAREALVAAKMEPSKTVKNNYNLLLRCKGSDDARLKRAEKLARWAAMNSESNSAWSFASAVSICLRLAPALNLGDEKEANNNLYYICYYSAATINHLEHAGEGLETGDENLAWQRERLEALLSETREQLRDRSDSTRLRTSLLAG